MSYILSFKRKGTVTPSGSDLVALGILPKQISEFTNADIGTEISIPYTDAGGVISGPIVFEVVGVNHHTNSEHQQTITLMTKNIIRNAAFDAKESGNPDSNRAEYGNNHWKCSNIRQWLNSSEAAGSWFIEKYENNEYDASPTADRVYNADGAYADEPGFLAGFSADVLQHFTDITNTTAVPTADGGGSETTVDKVFLPSLIEMGYGNNNGITEGTPLSLRYSDPDSKIKSGANGSYWVRSPLTDTSNLGNIINYDGLISRNPPVYRGDSGIAPIIVLH